MLTLNDLLTVCYPDWVEIGNKAFNVNRNGLPDHLLSRPVKRITGWDDGLTIELVEPDQKGGEHDV